MRWLLHGKFDPTVAEALRAHGHQALALAEAGVAEDAPIEMVIAAANAGQLDLISADSETAHVPFATRIPFRRSIALLESGGGEGIERFLERYPRPAPSRLYTITPSRIKVRQLPGKR
jgi:hypothetical protein